MNPRTFNRFRELVHAHSGISLGQGKEALVSARVARRMRELGLAEHEQYLARVEADPAGQEIILLLDCISTNVTSFYREPAHFALLGELARGWLAEGQTRFRFWSAACSSGEEPYSLAITLCEALGERAADVRILATDISTRILERAQEGLYDAEKVKPVSRELLRRHFTEERATGQWRVKPHLRQMITFRRFNLATPPFPMKGPMDAVFCRNVMIYFDNDTRRGLLGEIQRLLRPGGHLMVGHAESLTGMMCDLKVVQPSVYRKA